MTVPSIALRPDVRISRLIKGGWQLAGGHGAIDQTQALADMSAYVAAGFSAFDCADIYTGVEQLIGAWRQRNPAASVRVHTKFVPDLERLEDLSAQDARRMIERSCSRLGVDRLDLVQFHWWDYARGDFVAVARMLAELQAAQKIDMLGGTNFDAASTEAMLAEGVRLETMQVQYSLLDQRPAGTLGAICARTGMHLLCYGTLAGGFFSERWLGAAKPAEPLENRSLTKYLLIIEDCGGWDWFQVLLAVLARVGARHGVGIGALATRLVLDFPHVAACIVGVRSSSHLAAHAGLCDIALDARDRAEIDTVLAQRIALPGDVYSLERDRHGRHGRIMKYDLAKI